MEGCFAVTSILLQDFPLLSRARVFLSQLPYTNKLIPSDKAGRNVTTFADARHGKEDSSNVVLLTLTSPTRVAPLMR